MSAILTWLSFRYEITKISRFNPIVSIISFLLILGFVTYCIVDTAKALASFKEAKFMVAKNFTWLYVGSFVSFLGVLWNPFWVYSYWIIILTG